MTFKQAPRSANHFTFLITCGSHKTSRMYSVTSCDERVFVLPSCTRLRWRDAEANNYVSISAMNRGQHHVSRSTSTPPIHDRQTYHNIA